MSKSLRGTGGGRFLSDRTALEERDFISPVDLSATHLGKKVPSARADHFPPRNGTIR